MGNNRPWSLTPLDFIDDHGPGYSVNVQPFMKMPVIPPERLIQRIPNDRFPTNPYGSQEYLLCIATLVFTAIHVAGWNFSFPTLTERVLWRVSSLLLFCITLAFWLLETGASWIRLGRWTRLYAWTTSLMHFKHRVGRTELEKGIIKEPPKRMRDTTEDSTGEEHENSTSDEASRIKSEEPKQGTADQERVQFPLPWEFWSITPLALIYGMARFYMIIEALMELRMLEANAFVQVNWSQFIPHI